MTLLRNIFIIIVIILSYLEFQINYNSSYRIEVGATRNNFSGKYVPLFLLMDMDSDGILSHSEIMFFYKYHVVTNDNYPDYFFLEDGRWRVSTGLKSAAIEYYTYGEIVTPELKEKYDGYFVNINSGVKK